MHFSFFSEGNVQNGDIFWGLQQFQIVNGGA